METISYIKNNYCKIDIFNNNVMNGLLNKKILMIYNEDNDVVEIKMSINKELFFKFSFQLLGYKWYSFFKTKKNVSEDIEFYYPREYWKLYIFDKKTHNTLQDTVFYNLREEIKKYL